MAVRFQLKNKHNEFRVLFFLCLKMRPSRRLFHSTNNRRRRERNEESLNFTSRKLLSQTLFSSAKKIANKSTSQFMHAELDMKSIHVSLS